jgi:hypothetical protein
MAGRLKVGLKTCAGFDQGKLVIFLGKMGKCGDFPRANDDFPTETDDF